MNDIGYDQLSNPKWLVYLVLMYEMNNLEDH